MSVEDIYNRNWSISYDGDEIIIEDRDLKFCYVDGNCVIFENGEVVGEICVEGYSNCDDVVGVYEKVAYLLWYNPPESLL